MFPNLTLYPHNTPPELLEYHYEKNKRRLFFVREVLNQSLYAEVFYMNTNTKKAECIICWESIHMLISAMEAKKVRINENDLSVNEARFTKAEIQQAEKKIREGIQAEVHTILEERLLNLRHAKNLNWFCENRQALEASPTPKNESLRV